MDRSQLSIDVFLAVGGALTAIFKWVWEYSKKLKWDKNKFLLEELEKFHSLETTQAMEMALDWNSASIELNGVKIKFDDDLLYESFSTHDVKHTFTTEQLLLRGLFDEYFDNLTRLVFMAKAGLVEERNLRLFLNYWIEILNGKNSSKPPRLRIQIKNYLLYYSYNTLLTFINKEKK